MGIDELYWKKGQRNKAYVTLFYPLDKCRRRLPGIVRGHAQKDLRRGLRTPGTEVLAAVRYVCSDIREFLRAWVTRAKRRRIAPLREFAETLQRHEPMLLNWIQARDEILTGAVEGLNNKWRVVTRRACGCRSFHVPEIMLDHTLGKLPMPELTRRFCEDAKI